MKHVTKAMAVFALVAGHGYAQVPKEIALGRQITAEFDARHNMVTDAQVIDFVQSVLKNLSRDEFLRLPLTLRVVEDSEAVASALPGGTVLLSSGAILQAENEAELAALLSHAMGHVQAGQSSRSNPSTTGIPVIFMGGPWGYCVRARNGRRSMLAQTDLFETQADFLGLGYLTHAGYDPQALVSVFAHGEFSPREEVKSMAVALTNASTVLNTSAFDEIRRRLTLPPTPRPAVPTLYK